MTRSLVGTDEYLAPEMIQGSKVWSAMVNEGKGRAAGAAAAAGAGAAVVVAAAVAAAAAVAVAGASDCGSADADANTAALSLSKDPLQTLAPQVSPVIPGTCAYTGYDQSVDFWALGALLYEMLSGESKPRIESAFAFNA